MPEGWLVEMTIIFLGIVFFHHLPERFKVMFQASTSCDLYDLYVWFIFIPWRLEKIYYCFKAGFCSLFHVLPISPMKCSIRSPWLNPQVLLVKYPQLYPIIYIYILLVLFDTDFCWGCFTVYYECFFSPLWLVLFWKLSFYPNDRYPILPLYMRVYEYIPALKKAHLIGISHDIPIW